MDDKRIKVLIADDEESIGLLILHLVDWEELNMQVVQVVQNGYQAIEAVKKETIDIVITDIRMPGIDGLEMIKELKQLNPAIQYIVISGYKDFAYAKIALQYGVTDYILKPVNKMELQSALYKIAEGIIMSREKLKQVDEINIMIGKHEKKIRKQLLENIRYNNIKGMNLTEESCNREYQMNFQKGCYQMALFKLDIDSQKSEEATIYIYNILEAHLEKQIGSICYDYEIECEQNMYYVVLNYNKDEEKEVERILKGILKSLLWAKDIIENVKITIGLGKSVAAISEIRESYNDAKLAVEERIIKGTNQLIRISLYERNYGLKEEELLKTFRDAVISSANQLNVREIICNLTECEKHIVQQENLKGHQILQLMKGIVNVYNLEMKNLGLMIEDDEDYFEGMIYRIENIGTLGGMFEYLIREIEHSFTVAITKKTEQEYYPIIHAKKYIEQHYNENITLKEVADIVNYNSNYFSTLFKKETGETFNEYIVKYRLEMAKEMLRTTTDTIESIAGAVGYNDMKHFNKIFKKNTTLKPSEYRKIFSQIRSKK